MVLIAKIIVREAVTILRTCRLVKETKIFLTGGCICATTNNLMALVELTVFSEFLINLTLSWHI